MPFHQLKKALMSKKRGGEKSPDGKSVLFYKNDDKLIFSGTNEMIIGLDGKKHERVEIMLNGDELNLSPWLHEETPILMTGNKVVKNKRGKPKPKNCIDICDNILNDLGFQKYDLGKKIESANDNEANKDIDVNNEDHLPTKEEREMNDNFYYDYFEKRELYFSREILTRYFLSLRTKPFVILTGAYSAPFRPPIPEQIGHPFRLIPATNSGAFRPL